MKDDDLEPLLRKMSMLASLSPWQMELVIEAGNVVDVSKKTVVLESGSDDGHTYFLIEGAVALVAGDGKVSEIAAGSSRARTPIAHLRPRLYEVRARDRVALFRVPDIVLRAAGCNDHFQGDDAIAVSSAEEDEQHQAETKLSFQLYQDLKEDRVALPSLPDLALRIRQLMDDDVSDAKSIARVVESDPAIAAKLLKASNSALYGGMSSIESTSSAIVRLGMENTKQLVLGFALNDVFKVDNAAIRKKMRGLWAHSTYIAASCFVLAKEHAGLDAEHALLAGLVHDVGLIPILNQASNYPILAEDEAVLAGTLRRLRGEMSALILRKWLFPADIVSAARDAENWTRHSDGPADLTDLLIVARIHERLLHRQIDVLPPFREMTAVRRVIGSHASPEKSLAIIRESRQKVEQMRSIFDA
jgi:HD-like signal output (HDOD) protein